MPRQGLHTISATGGAKSSRKRVGRGLGSKGTYSGRGSKGQRARSGSSGHLLRGLRPTMLATPKSRGFISGKGKLLPVNLDAIQEAFKDGAVVTPAALVKRGLISAGANRGVKILGRGEVTMKLTVKNCEVSAKAKEKIEAAGVTLI